jgi:hypothetical protein
MGLVIKPAFNAFKEVEKMLKARFWDKERERSQRASGLAQIAQGTKRRCPLRHDMIAWSGPPHDAIRCYVCLRCNAAASEPEIKDRGHDFDTVPDWLIHEILDLDLQRQAGGSKKMFAGFGDGAGD